MALLEGHFITSSYDSVFDTLKSVLIDNLGFVCDSDTGTSNGRIMIFSLSSYYHKIKWYWNGGNLTYAYLKIDNTTAIYTSHFEYSYNNIFYYKIVNFNNTRALLLYVNNAWSCGFLYCTSGGTEKHQIAKRTTYYYYYAILTGNNDTIDSSNTGLAITSNYSTKNNNDILSPIVLNSEIPNQLCNASLDDIYACGSLNLTIANVITLGTKKYIIATYPNVDISNLLIRYE